MTKIQLIWKNITNKVNDFKTTLAMAFDQALTPFVTCLSIHLYIDI